MTNKIVAIQGNHPSKLNPKTDTSVFLANEIQKKNYRIFYYEPKDLTPYQKEIRKLDPFSIYALVATQEAISMSGYTTSISPKDAYVQNDKSSTTSYTSSEIVKKIIKELSNEKETYSNEEIRDILLNLSTEKLTISLGFDGLVQLATAFLPTKSFIESIWFPLVIFFTFPFTSA